MESQRWKRLAFEYRRPGHYDWINATTLGVLLHLQPQVPEAAAVLVAIAALRCIRYRRAV
ncbi:hypothetical protein [Actinacidiphila glaucinigra]|uniref:hypothetical protein n=1 Tax=Actinacidiphila glaucinigra TaxID=235986 RepID=UPI0035DAA7C9